MLDSINLIYNQKEMICFRSSNFGFYHVAYTSELQL